MSRHILLAEDEEALRDQLVEVLDRHRYSVDSAADGAQALALGEAGHYDLAIIDLGLPKLNGMEVISRLRERGKDYPVLILTARADWQDKVEGLSAGADDYLVNPYALCFGIKTYRPNVYVSGDRPRCTTNERLNSCQ